ncbi:hypothetical protein [Terrarubrum flagellatum]|uniref:hypothetical protein n=1 Tax=Terrirubrum flagellatum TaxID=2895980 RepID=UPI003144F38A
MALTRYERRLRRRRHEEVMAWVVLPIIVVVVYFIGAVAYTNLRESLPSIADLKSLQEKVRR